MKLLLLIFGFWIFCSNSFGQKIFVDSLLLDNPYLLYKSKNIFQIIESNDAKTLLYPSLTIIEYYNSIGELVSISPEEFIVMFKNKEINLLKLNIQRSRYGEKWYRLGNTNFVLIGYSEDQIAKDYSKTLK